MMKTTIMSTSSLAHFATILLLWTKMHTGMIKNDQDHSGLYLGFLGMPQGVRDTFRISKKLTFKPVWPLWQQRFHFGQDLPFLYLEFLGMPQGFRYTFWISKNSTFKPLCTVAWGHRKNFKLPKQYTKWKFRS